MAPVTTSWNLDLLDPRLSGITMDAANRPTVYEKLVDKKDGNNRKLFPMPDKVKTLDVGTLGTMAETEEHNPYYEDNPPKGYTKETAYKKFTLQTTFTEEVLDDDLYGITEEYAKQFGDSYNLTRNLQVGQLYDNLHATTYFTAPDTKAICATDHTSRASAASRSNKLSTSESFSYSGVMKLLTQARRQTDMRGYPNPALVNGTVKVLIQPEDEWMYTHLFSERSQFNPENNSNAPNPLIGSGRSFTPIINEYQTGTGTTSTRLWTLIDGTETGIWLVDRWPLKPHSYLQDGNLSMSYMARARYWFHVKTWEKIYGSGD